MLWGVVCEFLREEQWSPQEIEATLRRVLPDDPSLHACLRQHRNKRLPRSRGTDGHGGIPDTVSIHVRPPEVDDRLMPELTATANVRVYFCDPHSTWQRGTCENTNGLLRQYLPKGTDLSVYSQEYLDTIADKPNTQPRATLNWHTPLEIISQILANPTDRVPVH